MNPSAPAIPSPHPPGPQGMMVPLRCSLCGHRMYANQIHACNPILPTPPGFRAVSPDYIECEKCRYRIGLNEYQINGTNHPCTTPTSLAAPLWPSYSCGGNKFVPCSDRSCTNCFGAVSNPLAPALGPFKCHSPGCDARVDEAPGWCDGCSRDTIKQRGTKCECGSAACGSSAHSTWCPAYERTT